MLQKDSFRILLRLPSIHTEKYCLLGSDAVYVCLIPIICQIVLFLVFTCIIYGHVVYCEVTYDTALNSFIHFVVCLTTGPYLFQRGYSAEWSSRFKVIQWQVHSHFHSEFYTVCDPVLLLSVSSILSFSWGYPLSAYVFFPVFPSLLCFLLSFLQKHVFEGSSYARCDQSS